jgi:tetratricopeptide (TPR) repeat protein
MTLREWGDMLRQDERYGYQFTDEAINKADIAFNSKEWSRAIELYEAAKQIKNETYPERQITKAQEELSSMQNAQQRKASFDQITNEAMKLFGEKNYVESAKEFENALNYADTNEDRKATQEKLDEIKTIFDEIEGLERKKKAYDLAITQAEEAENTKDWSLSLAKYKEAQSIDDSQTLPSRKIPELEQKIKEQEANSAKQNAFDAQIEKGDELFDSGKFDDAISAFNEANNIIPNHPLVAQKIEEVNQKRKEIEQNEAEKVYQDILTKANNARTDEKYDEAIKLYGDASKQRPNDPLPIEKIREIEQEIKNREAELADKAKREQEYQKLMAVAAEKFDAESWKESLDNYKNASALFSDREEPKQRIEQITNIIATIEKEKTEKLNQELAFAELVKSGDKLFSSSEFDQALSTYEDALEIKNNIDVERKIEITKAKIAEQEKKAQEAIWKKKLKEADNAFQDKSYVEAKDLYLDVLTMNPQHKRSSEQVELIDRILSPSISNNRHLEDFGNPSYHSIIEGEALMLSADRQREYARLKKLRSRMIEMEKNIDESYEQNGLDTRGIYSNTKDVERDEEKFRRERKEAQMLADEEIRKHVASMSRAELLEQTIAYKDLIAIQNELRKFVEGKLESEDGNYKFANLNEAEIKAYLLQIAENTSASEVQNIELLLNNDKFIQLLLNADQDDTDIDKVLRDLNEAFIRTLMNDLRSKESEQITSQLNNLNQIIKSLDEYAAFLNDQGERIYENELKIVSQVDAISKGIYEDGQIKLEQHFENSQYLLNLLTEATNALNEENEAKNMDQSRYNERIKSIENAFIDNFMDDMFKNYLLTQKNDQELKKIYNVDSKEFELWANELLLNYTELREIQRRIDLSNDKIEETRKQQSQATESDINKILAAIYEDNRESHEQQILAEGKITETEREYAKAQEDRLAEARERVIANRQFLDQLERQEIKFNNETANALGQEFPEGVTEENFVTHDSDGLVSEVKTRRIVVINGHADVYMRYSNRFGVTYTKNGQAITEYMWTKETQNAKLPKYKIN